MAVVSAAGCQITGGPPATGGPGVEPPPAAASPTVEPIPDQDLERGSGESREQLTSDAARAYDLGMERLAEGLHEDALSSFLKAAEAQGEPSALIETRIATMLQQLGRHAEAVERLDIAIRLHDSANLRARRAWAHLETGDCAAAVMDAEAAVLIPLPEPTAHSHAEAWRIRAECSLKAGDEEQALRDAREALKEAERAGSFGPDIGRFREMVERLEAKDGPAPPPAPEG